MQARIDGLTSAQRQDDERQADVDRADVGANRAPLVEPLASRTSLLTTTVLTTATEVDLLAADCESLIRDPLEPNVFYEPWMLSAALRSLSFQDVSIVVIRHRTAGPTGIFPLQLERRFRGLPLPALRSWQHPYCFLCTPLVSAAYASETVGAFLDWVDSHAAPANLIAWELVAADGPFHSHLAQELSKRHRWRLHLQQYQRAFFRGRGNGHTAISAKHLKELRRLKRRLSESGQCTYRVLQPGEPIEGWISRFLSMEAAGWKGREGTALASDEGSRQFFEEVTAAAAMRQRLQMLAIELNGVPVAMKCNFLAGEGAFAFKIAYDERFSRYSPGVLLELFNMTNLEERSLDIRWMDSCASPQHFMIDRLWVGRRTLGDYLIASRGIAALMVRHLHRYNAVRAFLKRRTLNRGGRERSDRVESST